MSEELMIKAIELAKSIVPQEDIKANANLRMQEGIERYRLKEIRKLADQKEDTHTHTHTHTHTATIVPIFENERRNGN